MLFGNIERDLRFGRLRLRGFTGASDEFLLAAAIQALWRFAKLAAKPPTPISLVA